MARPAVLTFGSESDDPFVAHALRQLSVWLGVAFIRAVPDRNRPLSVYYGGDTEQPCAIRIPLATTFGKAELPALPTRQTVEGWQRDSESFPFDLFATLRFWLADEGNNMLAADAFDKYDRLVAKRSLQHMVGLRELPAVNHYVECLRVWMEGRCCIETHRLLPEGCRAAVVLTHDVDDPSDPGDPRHVLGVALNSLRTGGRRLAASYWSAGFIGRAALSRVRRPNARHWLFTELVAAESRRGFKSTFFFAPLSRFDRLGCDLDVAYDIRDKRFRPVFDLLREQGFGVGVHLSYGALDDAARIRQEREVVETTAGCDVIVSRHHYWHMTRPMWRSLAAHADAGLTFDSSVSFQDLPGFRLGVALPFEPWDPDSQQTITTVQIPTMVMDTMLFDGGSGAGLERALDRFDSLLNSLKGARGIAAIDWHEYTSLPAGQRREPLGHLYLAILDRLAADPDVVVLDYPAIEHTLRAAVSTLPEQRTDALRRGVT